MSVSKSHQVTRDNFAGRKDISTVIKVNRSDVELDELPLIVKEQDIGHAFILGHSVNGVLGTANGIDGSQITLGTAGYGALTTESIINYQNTFREYVRDSTFIDAVNTTATANLTLHTIEFADGATLRSENIFHDGGKLLDKGTILNIPNFTSGSSTITYYLSPDSGSNWESVSVGEEHIFTNSGTALRYRLDVNGGTAQISIEDGDGFSSPIKINYKTRG